MRAWLPHLAAILFILLAAAVVIVLRTQSERIGAQAQANSALASGVSQLRSQVRQLGGTPAVPPPQVIISGLPGATGQQGPGPSDAQIAAAVAAYLVAHPVPGVSAEQVAAAVKAQLLASPPPSGPAGPGPSDQQIADAVASYMAANPAPSGPAGKDGSNGADGSPPAGWSFEADGVTYDCVPDGGTPAPHYTCPPAPPSPSGSQSAAPSSSLSAAPSASATPGGTLTLSPSPTPSATPAVAATHGAATTAAFVHPRGTPKPQAPALTLLPLELFPPPRRQP